MVHMIGHYGSLAAKGFAGLCALMLVYCAIVILQISRSERKNIAWEFPAIFAGLGAFWYAVGLALNLL